jgi:hypothetical protein
VDSEQVLELGSDSLRRQRRVPSDAALKERNPKSGLLPS